MKPWGLPVILFIGLLIRFLLIPNPGFEADVAFWKSWSLAAADHGVVWMTQNTNNNYPPAFGYVLWSMGKMYALLANPHNFNNYWNAGNFTFLFVAKLIAIVSDVVITLGIYWLLSHPSILEISRGDKENKRDKRDGKFQISLLGAAMYFLHPVPILDGAWWGQVDAFGVMFLLLSLILLLKKHPAAAFFTLVLGFLFKLQNIIYIPIIIVYILRRFGIKSLGSIALAGFLAWIVGALPFLLSKKVDTALYLLGANADWFPWLSLHAYNPWWIVGGTRGMGFSDKFLFWGILTPKTIGLIFFSCAYLVSLWVVILKPLPKVLFISLFLSVFSFFMLLTQSHERYIFPAFLFFPLFLGYCLAGDKEDKGSKKNNHHWVIAYPAKLQQSGGLFGYFLILSLIATFDIHRTLIFNYPANGLPFLSLFRSDILTLFAAIANVILYLLAFFFTTLSISPWILPVIFAVLAGGLIGANRDYLFANKVSLATLKTTGWSQDFAPPQTNLTVSSFSGPKSWTRLSSLYFFYPHGIGAHAKSELSYELRGKFSRLSTDYGIDTEANIASSVMFQVIGNGKTLFESGKMGRFDLPRHADVDITGINDLKLVILPTQDGNRDDHADWLNPVLYK